MSLIRVTNTNNSGSGSLRNAVDTANPGDDIQIVVSGTITLINPIDINKTLNIVGHPGLAISGSNTRIFNISGANTTVRISRLTLENGNDITGAGGGAILNNGARLVVSNCTFLNNKSSTTGGAIAIQNAGKVGITRSIFNGNTATTGGAISNFFPLDTDLRISDSRFSNNSAKSGNGGAIANNGTLLVIMSTLDHNSAPNGVGGAIASSGKATILRTLIERNTATSGGAIANIPPGTITITRSIIRGNSLPETIGVAPTVDESSSVHHHHHHRHRHRHHHHHHHHHHDESDDESSS